MSQPVKKAFLSRFTPTHLPRQTIGERRVNSGFGIWAKGSYCQSRRTPPHGGLEVGHDEQHYCSSMKLLCLEFVQPGKASPSSPISSLAVPPPPPSASCSKGQRSGRPCRLPWAVPGTSPSPARIRLPCTAPADVPQPRQGPTAPSIPNTTFFWRPAQVAPRDTQMRKLSLSRGHNVGTA